MTTTIEEVIDAIAAFGLSQVCATNESNRGKGFISKRTQAFERKSVAKLLELCTGAKPEAKDIDAVIEKLS